jgi:repressor LexA
MSSQREVFSKNLRKLIDKKGIDQRVLADYLETSEMSVSNWVNGNKYPRMGNIQKLADYFGVKKSDLIEDNENKQVYTSSVYNYFPTSVSAGLPTIAEPVASYETEKITVPDSVMGKWAGDKDIYMMRVNGESMNRIIPNGSLIAVKPIEPHNLKDGDIVVYSDDFDYAVKRYYRDDSRLIFRPDSNQSGFYDYITDTDNSNLKIHGKVVVYIVELD